MSDLLPQRLLTVATQYPERCAIRQGSTEISFGVLAAKIRALDAALRARIEPGERVALVMENSVDYVASCYAVWLSGGVVVGLNTAVKPDDLLWQIEHCAASCVIADTRRWQELDARLPERVRACSIVAGAVPSVVALDDLYRAPFVDVAPVVISADSPAQIIYTSGTTGRPKGVLLSHGNLASNIVAIQDYLGIRADDVAMCVLPFFYSFGNSVLHSHLTVGSGLVLENSLMYPQ